MMWTLGKYAVSMDGDWK